MIDVRKASSLALILISLAACAPQTRFEWGGYEPTLYAYYKDSNARSSYETALTKAIEAGRKNNKVAPGLCAELGYMQLQDGNQIEAKASFEEEMALFPESRTFLTGVIERMSHDPSRKEPIS